MQSANPRPVEQQPQTSEPGQLSHFPTARQAPVHFERIELLLWVFISSQLGQVVSGPELLKIGWDNKGRDGSRLNWNHPDKETRGLHRHLVIGAFNRIRRSVDADGDYTIDTTYSKRDGESGWRLRETTDEDIPRLRQKGYHGAATRRMAALAERAAIATEARRPALESGPGPVEQGEPTASTEPLPADEPDAPVAEGAVEQGLELLAERPDLVRSSLDHQRLPLETESLAAIKVDLEVQARHLPAELVKSG